MGEHPRHPYYGAVDGAFRFGDYFSRDEMKRTIKIWFPAMLVGALVADGCASRTASEVPAATVGGGAADDAETYGLREHHRYHQGGIGLFFAMGLETLGTSPHQGAGIERVRAKLRASMEPLHTAHRRLLATLADGLSSGTLNPSTVDAAVLGVSSAALAVRDALASSLNDLHAVLTPSQRTAMADKVEAHWSVWRAENVGSQGALPGTEQGHLSALTTELDLSPAQQEKIRETLKSERTEGPPFDQQQAGARLHALAEAFGQQHFDARAIEQSGPEPGMAAWGAAHLARVVEAMSPVLSAEQRSQLAEKLREHAGHAGVVEGSS